MNNENKQFLRITAEACGYHSEATYSETIYLPVEYKDEINEDNLFLYISDLDGKHSECKADIGIKVLTTEEIQQFAKEEDDGDDLYWTIHELVQDNEKFRKDYFETQTFLRNLDRYKYVSLRVKDSQVEQVERFISSLN